MAGRVWGRGAGQAMLVVLALLLLRPARAGDPQPAPTLGKILNAARGESGEARFHPPPRPQFDAVVRAVAALTRAARTCDERARQEVDEALRPLALEVIQVQSGARRFWVLRETPPVFRGSGVYVCRCGKAAPLVIQTPHGDTDLHTGRIGRALFARSQARWFFSSTVSRYDVAEPAAAETVFFPADAAHNPNHLFQAATLGLLEVRPQWLIVQVHGFDAKGRKADVIVSDARWRRRALSSRLIDHWKQDAFRVRVYGKGVRELGGVTNVQAEAVAQREGRFLHLEMSLAVRESLRADRPGLRKLAAALAALARELPPPKQKG